MAATQILAIAATVGTTAEFSLTADTLVFMNGPRDNATASFAQIALEVKDSTAAFSDLLTMGGPVRSGVLPAGDYRVTRISGNCGFQKAA